MMIVREMTAADIPAVSRLRLDGWHAAYRGLIPQSYLDGMSAEADAEWRAGFFARSRDTVTDFVAEVDGTLGGWLSAGPARGCPGGTGEIYAVYARPDLIGTGVGRALVSEAHGWAAGRGFTSIVLWVLDGNARAERFYRLAGYEPDGAVQADDYDGTELKELRYSRRLA
ncbi:GNAT family N-acetyltransferase [Longispora albida]|uniref:GNAT family N-acetyltransferase n=1 Tax=Longispora albida TaxID=203523 RepID=UPI000368D40C|nr:GNAT family N-acetyltransferase [Longispora albida]